MPTLFLEVQAQEVVVASEQIRDFGHQFLALLTGAGRDGLLADLLGAGREGSKIGIGGSRKIR
ncbi:MAG: hypothetical protein H7330_15315 [Hymenobacteraceae bacterium]|nr:hypothetical protein [Hymenobacteraceae bacterium]